jgi:hypothetical protein
LIEVTPRIFSVKDLRSAGLQGEFIAAAGERGQSTQVHCAPEACNYLQNGGKNFSFEIRYLGEGSRKAS